MEQALYTPHTTDEDCSCPIHVDGKPQALPLGVPFADRVSIDPDLDREVAEAIYGHHHSYMDDLPDINICHHGILFDSDLVGAITYRAPLLGKLKVFEGPDGQLTRDEETAQENGWEKHIICGGDIIEVNRICIGAPFKNMASCGLAASMDQFIIDHAARLDAEWLMTFIRVDHVGSMLKALMDKAWQMVGISQPKQAGNRPDKEIREWAKQRWLCHIDDVTTVSRETVQITFDEFTASPVQSPQNA
ncbi:hypothetical protein [Halorussus sp. AFM4]|uniref:hypothetical protein n=1 Tax=Halorussus sp. AFM4 TaxID=3421651 RepID=UPI003EBDE1CB